MSLDVYLTLPHGSVSGPAVERIFVRRDGGTVEITRAEWDELNPGREPVALVAEMDGREVFTANITHNLGRMASECGLYEPLWEAEDKRLTTAAQLVTPIRDGLALLTSDRARFEAFNPENGWGDYDGLVRFAENYLAACEQWPEAEVRVWR